MNHKEIFKKFKNFTENIVRLDERVYSGFFGKKGRYFKRYYLDCPCKKSRLYGEDVECNKEGKVKYEFISHATFRIKNHIEHQIRVNACKLHIELLIKIVGDKEALDIIDYWSKKNIIVGLALKRYVDSMRKSTQSGVSTTGGKDE